MQECMSKYPTLYPADDDDDEDDRKDSKEGDKKAMASLESTISKTNTGAVADRENEPSRQEKQVVSQ
ncbi:hypothetical protein IscW_ISCW003728 [Ixodes scapularis]|uniref:Uncharacterized protein n=2 Tax=Ixodes scapularis TaxID=6945 RepID=B7PJ33_IXOSC|nr:hypothetical protein IscW_ISCW003728 [Ixodes scapularis]|eukprot:XP_002406959.1 hypothetical protein IscW_ISCW003728 [Ixodes scapularis]